MKIKDYFDDIFTDMDTAQNRHLDSMKDMGVWNTSRRRNSNFGLLYIFAPQIVGFIFGLAVCRMLTLDGFAYIIFGVIGALFIGTFKSVEFDKISFKHALIRNLLMDAAVLVIGIVGFLIGML